MADRVALANQVRADLFLSIHCNGNQAAWYRGLETFFHSVEASSEEARRVASEENAMGGEKKGPGQDAVASILMDMQRAEVLRDSSQMAQLLHSRLVPLLGFPDHGVMQADFFVLRSTRMPAALVEVGFITNPVEEQTVRRSEVQEQVAKACLEAVRDYRALMERKEVRSVPVGP
jgi:N-acetylmuramoyl-L-alanine amidase